MAQRTANVTSTEAVKALKLALQQFADEAAGALIQLDLESRRASDWVDERSRYWPAQERKSQGQVSEARQALERCELTISGEDTKYAYEERKQLEKAKRRQRLCEEKVQAIKRWRMEIQKEVEAFQVQLAKLQFYLDSDFLKAIVAVERVIAALDRYVMQPGPSGPEPSSTPAPSAEPGEAP